MIIPSAPVASEPSETRATEYAADAGKLEQLVLAWEHANQQRCVWEGVQVRLLAEALDLALRQGSAGTDADVSVRSVAAELACAAAVSDRTLQAQMSDAAVLRDRFRATFDALQAGRLSGRHAQVIADEGIRLDDDRARATYERLVLERGAGLTTGRLRALAKSVAERSQPIPLHERHAIARSRRCVEVREGDDGMALLQLLGPAVLIHGIHDRLTQQARCIQQAVHDADSSPDAAPEDAAPRDDRTLDQLRADILCDLALTGHGSAAEIDAHGGEGIDAIRAIVQITVPVETLTGASEAPAQLAGRGPLDADTARRLAGNATIWHRLFTDSCTGEVIATDRRFPVEAQCRLLRARDEHCRFPGCRMPVWRCDVDHTVAHHDGGPTAVCNLAHLCRRHHTLKHHGGWTTRQLGGGVLEWTSPTGRIYTDRPAPTLRFIPADDPVGARAAPG